MNNDEQLQDSEQDAVYVEPNIEHELSKDKRQICRDIVKEVKEFGVNQRQILFLIQLLAMELENREALRTISKAVGDVRKEIPVGNKLIIADQTPRAKKLIF